MKIVKIPDSEFQIMKILWSEKRDMTTKEITNLTENSWKIQTVLTLLKRLEDKNFVSSKRIGKERVFSSLLGESEYLSFQAKDFVRRFHENSLVNLFASFCRDKGVDLNTKKELREWLSKN